MGLIHISRKGISIVGGCIGTTSLQKNMQTNLGSNKHIQ